MISKKAEELLESSHYGQWNNSWWEGPEYLGEVVKHEDVIGIISESENEILELVEKKILEKFQDGGIKRTLEIILKEVIGEIKNEK